MPDTAVSPVYAIIGASGGIGSVVCRRLTAGGARLAVAARERDRLEALAAELDAFARPLDARDVNSVGGFVDEAAALHGRLDGVVNLAGSILLRPAHRTSADDWNEVLAQNLGTAFATVRAAAKTMRTTGGSVVLMSSAAARVGLPNHEAIAAAKAGIEGLTRAAAATYASRGIRVNAVAPGLVRTPLSARLTSTPAAEAASAGLHALGRIGEPEDVATVITLLLNPAASWITGQVLGVDGGLASVRPTPRSG